MPMPWDIQKQQMLDKALNDNRALQKENDQLKGRVANLSAELQRSDKKIAKLGEGNAKEQKRLAAPQEQPVQWYDQSRYTRLTWGRAFNPFYWLLLSLDKPKVGLLLLPVWQFLAILAWVLFVAIVTEAGSEDRTSLLGSYSATASGAADIWFWQWVWIFERIGNLFSFLTS